MGVNLEDIAKEVKAAKSIIDDISSILGDASRSAVIEVDNATSSPLSQVARDTPHGAWAKFPASSIDAFKADAFGTKSSAGAIGVGTTASIDYAIDDQGTRVHFFWEVPFAGSNSYSVNLYGPNKDLYVTDGIIAGGNKSVNARFAIGEAASSNPVERDWRFCGRCKELFFSPEPSGLCPANFTDTQVTLPAGGKGGKLNPNTNDVTVRTYGPHDAQGWTLGVPFAGITGPNRESSCRRCGKCQALFYDGYAVGKGKCPGYSGHHEAVTDGELIYMLPFDIPLRPNQQTEWRICDACYALFFWPQNAEGSCQATHGKHDPGTANFILNVM